MQELALSLERSPELFPYALDIDREILIMIRLAEQDYQHASFLDERVLNPTMRLQTYPWHEVIRAVETAGLEERCSYVFHIGHVGSTLISRLIGSHPGILSIREPLLLRSFAQRRDNGTNAFDADLGTCIRLLSRTFSPRQRAVVKATSFVSELATKLLSRRGSPRGLAICVSPESYLATILAGENSRREARVLAPSRAQRLRMRLEGAPWNLDSMTEGEIIALGWATECCALAGTAGFADERVLPLDFDAFLEAPSTTLHRVLKHFEVDVTYEEATTIVAGPHMRRYSKAQEFAYDPALRRDVLNAARTQHGVEIRRGLAWLEKLAVSHETLRHSIEWAHAQAAPT